MHANNITNPILAIWTTHTVAWKHENNHCNKRSSNTNNNNSSNPKISTTINVTTPNSLLGAATLFSDLVLLFHSVLRSAGGQFGDFVLGCRPCVGFGVKVFQTSDILSGDHLTGNG